MKYKGQQLGISPRSDVVVFPRDEGDVIFTLIPVLDYSEFNNICPQPRPGQILYPGGRKGSNTDDPSYQKSLTDWTIKHHDWVILKTLAASPDISWDSIKMDDPSTYHNYRKELSDAGFTNAEVNHLVDKCVKINTLDEELMTKARTRFLASKQETQVPT